MTRKTRRNKIDRIDHIRTLFALWNCKGAELVSTPNGTTFILKKQLCFCNRIMWRDQSKYLTDSKRIANRWNLHSIENRPSNCKYKIIPRKLGQKPGNVNHVDSLIFLYAESWRICRTRVKYQMWFNDWNEHDSDYYLCSQSPALVHYRAK